MFTTRAYRAMLERMIEGIQHSHPPTTAWTRRGRRSTLRRMPNVPSAGLELTDAELATAATACRAMAYQEGKRAEAMENPTTRGPIEAASQRYERLAEKLEAAHKRRHP